MINRGQLRAGLIFGLLACGSPTEAPKPEPSVRLVYTTPTGSVRITDPDGLKDIPLTTSRPATMIAWSSEGLLAYYAHPSVYVLNPLTGEERVLAGASAGDEVHRIEWAPDGSRLLYVTGGRFRLVNPDGSFRWVLSPSSTADVVWSPDSRSIAFSASGIWIVGIDDTGLRQLTPKFAPRISWSPDGRYIAAELDGITVFPVDGSSSHVVATPSCFPICGSDAEYQHPSWSPDGSRIVAMVGTGLFTVNVDGTAFRQIVPNGTLSSRHETSSGSSLIAFRAGTQIRVIGYDETSSRSVSASGQADIIRWAVTK